MTGDPTPFRLSRLLCAAVLLAFIVSLAAPTFTAFAQPGTAAAVNSGRLNIRTGPSIAYPVITSLPFNTQVILVGRAINTTWVQVTIPDGRQGWANFLYMRSFARLDSLPITWTQPVPPTNPNPVPPPITGPVYYTVRAGDTLQIIAARYGTTWQAIAALNNLPNPNFIYTGQRLLVRGGSGVVLPPVSGSSHIVQPGETLLTIAARYGTTWPAIAAANNLANPNLIYVGQRLVIPAAPARPPQIYVVQRGDDLASIARRFGTTVQIIATANNLANPNLIYPGQRLTIP